MRTVRLDEPGRDRQLLALRVDPKMGLTELDLGGNRLRELPPLDGLAASRGARLDGNRLRRWRPGKASQRSGSCRWPTCG